MWKVESETKRTEDMRQKSKVKELGGGDEIEDVFWASGLEN